MIYQAVLAVSALAVGAMVIAAIIRVVLSPRMRFKPLWIIGSMFGVVGLGVDWTRADDISLLLGVVVPPIHVFEVGGHLIVEATFPIIALVALIRATAISDAAAAEN